MRIVEDILNWTRKKACLQLHIPHIEAHYSLEFFDEQGNLTKVREGRSKSWFRNGYQIAIATLTGYAPQGGYSAGNTSWLDTGGSVRTTIPITNSGVTVTTGTSAAIRGGTGVTDFGIVIGTGTGAENFNGYTMGTLIAPGYGAGLATYQEQDLFTQSYNAGTKVFTGSHSRLFNNNSDANIQLSEIGLRWRNQLTGVSPTYFAQFCRDLISPAEIFLDKAQLRVMYSISLTYPA